MPKTCIDDREGYQNCGEAERGEASSIEPVGIEARGGNEENAQLASDAED